MTPLQAVTSRRGMEKGNMMRYNDPEPARRCPEPQKAAGRRENRPGQGAGT